MTRQEFDETIIIARLSTMQFFTTVDDIHRREKIVYQYIYEHKKGWQRYWVWTRLGAIPVGIGSEQKSHVSDSELFDAICKEEIIQYD